MINVFYSCNWEDFLRKHKDKHHLKLHLFQIRARLQVGWFENEIGRGVERGYLARNPNGKPYKCRLDRAYPSLTAEILVELDRILKN